MIWLSIVSLSVGVLMAQRFKIIVLAPATFVVLVVAIGAGVAQAKAPWLIITMIAAASVSMQVGYFVGMLVQHGLGARATRSPPFSHTTSARDTVH